MRFSTPEEVQAWANKTAHADYLRHLVIHQDEDGAIWQVDKNPYCTIGARTMWQRGYDGDSAKSYEHNPAYDTQYQRGAAMRRIIEAKR